MQRYTCLIICVFVPLLMAADASPPKIRSEAGIATVNRHETAIRRAQEAYHKAIEIADRLYLKDLNVAINVAMNAKNLDEANALNVEKDKTLKEQRTQHVSDASDDMAWLAGTTWKFHEGGGLVTYHPGGVVTCDTWNGKQGTWVPVAGRDSAIRQHEPGGTGDDVVITFTNDRQAAIWQYAGNKGVSFSVRVH